MTSLSAKTLEKHRLDDHFMQTYSLPLQLVPALCKLGEVSALLTQLGLLPQALGARSNKRGMVRFKNASDARASP
jgi:hypothetical protein